jgi:hypothetical protein
MKISIFKESKGTIKIRIIWIRISIVFNDMNKEFISIRSQENELMFQKKFSNSCCFSLLFWFSLKKIAFFSPRSSWCFDYFFMFYFGVHHFVTTYKFLCIIGWPHLVRFLSVQMKQKGVALRFFGKILSFLMLTVSTSLIFYIILKKIGHRWKTKKTIKQE